MAVSGFPDGRTTHAQSVCPYCGVGCRLWMEEAYGELIRVKGVTEATANRGGLCAKGATLPQVVSTPDRLAQPMLRRERGEEPRPVAWHAALSQVADRLREIIDRHGPDAVGFYGSGQLDTEAVYLAGKLFKGSLGTNNTDSNSRLCMAAAVAGYRSSLGADGPPNCYDDVDHADCIVVWGSNMAEAHPVTFDRIKARRKADPSVELIVVDPRRTPTAEHATLHIPVAPGGDIALMNALGQLLLIRGAVDPAFIDAATSGFAEYRDLLIDLDWDATVAASGVPRGTIEELAGRLARSRAWLTFWCMGLNQSTVGVWKTNSLINLHLMTGQIGRPGAGPFSLTGQPNAMGGREAGLLAQALPGYRSVADAAHRAEVEAYWKRPAGTISDRPGLTAIEMFRALESGRMKAVWIAATNPAVSLPDLHQVRRALAAAELVIVQDAYHPTETTRLADVLLPAAQWAEKQGTSTNSERRVSLSEPILKPPGAALPDWEILARTGQAMGFEGFAHTSPAAVWDEFIGLTAGRPCDMAGVTSERLAKRQEIQWPCPHPQHPGTARLYGDRRFPTPNGRARFLARPHRGPRETPDHEFPLVLTTGRLYAHWHTMTRTGKSPKLMQREPAAYVEVHPADAAARNLTAGQVVELSSRRGVLRLPVRLNDGLSRGLVFVPFHWGDETGARTAANYLTIPAIGRVAKQPEFKYCAVQIEAIPVGPDTPLPAPARTARAAGPIRPRVVVGAPDPETAATVRSRS